MSDKKIDYILNYIKLNLPILILKSNGKDLKNHKIKSFDVILSKQLVGFMSSIYIVKFITEDKNKNEWLHPMILKTMKGDEKFRLLSTSSKQFKNEIFIYKDVIKCYQDLLNDFKINEINTDNWIPKVFYADFGLYPDLSENPESFLALENLTYKNYRLGPGLDLDEDHLKLSIKILAEYHAMSYCMKLIDNNKFNNLISSIIPFPFESDDDKPSQYEVNYKIGVERFFNFYDRSPEYHIEPYSKYIEIFRQKYFKEPVKIQTKLYQNDSTYSVIIHGDYCRNNLLFQYENINGNEKPIDVKMFDFQQTRYTSPAFDLSFHLFFNMNPKNYLKLWDKLIKEYHKILLNTLCQVLDTNENDPRLKNYNFLNFYEHFKKFAFYGVMVCISFLPWNMCNADECEKVSKLFEKDMLGKEFHDYAKIIGGDLPNLRIIEIFKLAVDKGYAEILFE